MRTFTHRLLIAILAVFLQTASFTWVHAQTRVGGMHVDLVGGTSWLLGPDILTDAPDKAALQRDALLSGIDAAGFGHTVSGGLRLRIPLAGVIDLDAGVTYTEWSSKTVLMSATQSTGWRHVPTSEVRAVLGIVETSVGARFSFLKPRATRGITVNGWVTPQVSFNIIQASNTERSVFTGFSAFGHTYYRAGAGVMVGIDLGFGPVFGAGVQTGIRIPNLVFTTEDRDDTAHSESIISNADDRAESMMLILDLRLGISIRL